ncbi:MAG: 4Fe-4S cluster-binding domain-containing protein, partial [Muribaculaceae bacterium]|nr:4Fe-4S cluster-binding domain-containing protein [Muribaculaceae bacterium]
MPGLNIINVYPETIADGYGLRYAIYLAGCRHACPDCHNPESWSPSAGEPFTEEILSRIIDEINADTLLDGIT